MIRVDTWWASLSPKRLTCGLARPRRGGPACWQLVYHPPWRFFFHDTHPVSSLCPLSPSYIELYVVSPCSGRSGIPPERTPVSARSGHQCQMDSTNPGEGRQVLVEAPASKDEENAPSSLGDPATAKPEEPTFDTGLLAWLQVVGSFFLFFNSWYVDPLGTHQLRQSDR